VPRLYTCAERRCFSKDREGDKPRAVARAALFQKNAARAGIPESGIACTEAKLKGGRGYKGSAWYDAMTFKQDNIIKTQASMAEGITGIFVDIDVQFFPGAIAALTKECNGYDVCFMKEHYWGEDGGMASSGKGVNAGFLVANNNADSRAFFKDVLAKVTSPSFTEEKYPLADQSVIQEMLAAETGTSYGSGGKKLKWKTLSAGTVIGCCAGCAKVEADVLKTAKAHHAIACEQRGGRNNNKRKAFAVLWELVSKAQSL